jgi:outer membrane lipoprotein
MLKKWECSVIFLLLLFCACAPFPRQLMKEIDPSIEFRDLLKDPDAYIGKKILLGGLIIDIQNRKEETLLQVLQTDLDFEKRPIHLDQSLGRFCIRVSGFLDPAIYRKGREVTVIGEVVGKEISPIGEVPYTYPVIRAIQIRLWEKRRSAPPPYPEWFWGWGPYPYRWYWGPPY